MGHIDYNLRVIHEGPDASIKFEVIHPDGEVIASNVSPDHLGSILSGLIVHNSSSPTSVNTLDTSDYLTPTPSGWDTVLGWIAKHNPDLFKYADLVTAEHTLRDGYWLTHRCRERGITPIKVDAPPILARQGVKQVNAYPNRLLEMRLG